MNWTNICFSHNGSGGRGLGFCKTSLSPPVIHYWPVPRRYFHCVTFVKCYTPTYEVCGVYKFRFSIHSYVFSFVRTYVRSFVCTYVRSFVHSSFGHRVKVFALKFIRPHILKTLWWISFIFGMMVDIGLKFFISTIPTPGVTLGSRSGT